MKVNLHKSLFLILILTSCSSKNQTPMNLKNNDIHSYSFLKTMYEDSYFPKPLVDKGKNILIKLCYDIESKNPKNLVELYRLTHEATVKFNDLDEEFHLHDSEIETVARESIAADFLFIAKAYGFEADAEELIATRFW